MAEPTLYVDEAFCILLERNPPSDMTPQQRRIAVMEHWDGRKFDGDPVREMIARMALCQIGLAWHSTDRYPFTLELVQERLREFMPELGAADIDGRTLRDIAYGRHPIQYARRAGT